MHYGPASLTPVNSLPAFFVFPRSDLDVDTTAAAVARHISAERRSTPGAEAPSGGVGGRDMPPNDSASLPLPPPLLILIPDLCYSHAGQALAAGLQQLLKVGRRAVLARQRGRWASRCPLCLLNMQLRLLTVVPPHMHCTPLPCVAMLCVALCRGFSSSVSRFIGLQVVT